MKNKKTEKRSTKDDSLKLIGVMAMLVDHVGMIFFPQITFLRIVGRIAFPIFAYYLVQGFIHTSSLKKYILRLSAFAAISQLPLFFITSQQMKLNILFSLVFGLLALNAFKKEKYVILFVVILLSGIIPMEYSFYGIFIILSFYAIQDRKNIILVQSIFNGASYFILNHLQPFSILGTVIVAFYPKNLPKVRLNKYFFYIFYPVHLAVLYIIKVAFFNH